MSELLDTDRPCLPGSPPPDRGTRPSGQVFHIVSESSHHPSWRQIVDASRSGAHTRCCSGGRAAASGGSTPQRRQYTLRGGRYPGPGPPVLHHCHNGLTTPLAKVCCSKRRQCPQNGSAGRCAVERAAGEQAARRPPGLVPLQQPPGYGAARRWQLLDCMRGGPLRARGEGVTGSSGRLGKSFSTVLTVDSDAHTSV